ncbi:MAG: hypothetical protein AB203_00255 [Parcubacteria bacterium C7867-008]|nr:MAG: hypothetical protein AB203_00255 [Parcubacteria bacterium C7867-008]
MVATMHDRRVAIATGTARVDPSKLGADYWAFIIRHAASRLTMDYLHGLQSIEQIIKSDDQPYERSYDPSVFRIPFDARTKGIVCARLKDLPVDVASWPQIPADPGHDAFYQTATESVLVLERQRKGFDFWLLRSEWELMGPEEIRPWLRGRSLHARKVDLEEILQDNTELASNILFTLLRAQEETTARLTERSRVSLERAFELKNVLHATGHPVR